MGEEQQERTKAQEEERARIKVTDRRHFTSSGERRRQFDEEAETPPFPPPEEATRKASQGPGFERRPLQEPEGVDFTMLVNAMAQPALLFLGEIPHPGTRERSVDPEQARIQIDMLDLLRVKCRGNLSPEEEGLLERILYELRMLYVARTGRTAS